MGTPEKANSAHTPTPLATSYREIPGDKNGMMSQQIYDATGETIANCAWHPFEDEHGIFRTDREANAAFIVKACNNHEKLVKALEDARDALLSDPPVGPQKTVLADDVIYHLSGQRVGHALEAIRSLLRDIAGE